MAFFEAAAQKLYVYMFLPVSDISAAVGIEPEIL